MRAASSRAVPDPQSASGEIRRFHVAAADHCGRRRYPSARALSDLLLVNEERELVLVDDDRQRDRASQQTRDREIGGDRLEDASRMLRVVEVRELLADLDLHKVGTGAGTSNAQAEEGLGPGQCGKVEFHDVVPTGNGIELEGDPTTRLADDHLDRARDDTQLEAPGDVSVVPGPGRLVTEFGRTSSCVPSSRASHTSAPFAGIGYFGGGAGVAAGVG